MNLLDLCERPEPPIPWAEGDNIPWHDPDFSRRMLNEHLSQGHDAASRRTERVEAHVAWIHGDVLRGRPSRVLDLGCGPGLYANRLAALGHDVIGVDWSPTSIEHARANATNATFIQEDIRDADYGTGFDLVTLIFGELNVFRREHALNICRKARAALDDTGAFLVEMHTDAEVERIGQRPSRWRALRSGLFSDEPHLLLESHFWEPKARSATTRFDVIDATTGEATNYAQSLQAYSAQEAIQLLRDAGFQDVGSRPSLTGDASGIHPGLYVLLARK